MSTVLSGLQNFLFLIMSAPTDMSSLLASLSSTSVAGAAAPRSGDFSGGTSSLGAEGGICPLFSRRLSLLRSKEEPAIGIHELEIRLRRV
jgi:hypothetical protein